MIVHLISPLSLPSSWRWRHHAPALPFCLYAIGGTLQSSGISMTSKKASTSYNQSRHPSISIFPWKVRISAFTLYVSFAYVGLGTLRYAQGLGSSRSSSYYSPSEALTYVGLLDVCWTACCCGSPSARLPPLFRRWRSSSSFDESSSLTAGEQGNTLSYHLNRLIESPVKIFTQRFDLLLFSIHFFLQLLHCLLQLTPKEETKNYFGSTGLWYHLKQHKVVEEQLHLAATKCTAQLLKELLQHAALVTAPEANIGWYTSRSKSKTPRALYSKVLDKNTRNKNLTPASSSRATRVAAPPLLSRPPPPCLSLAGTVQGCRGKVPRGGWRRWVLLLVAVSSQSPLAKIFRLVPLPIWLGLVLTSSSCDPCLPEVPGHEVSGLGWCCCWHTRPKNSGRWCRSWWLARCTDDTNALSSMCPSLVVACVALAVGGWHIAGGGRRWGGFVENNFGLRRRPRRRLRCSPKGLGEGCPFRFGGWLWWWDVNYVDLAQRDGCASAAVIHRILLLGSWKSGGDNTWVMMMVLLKHPVLSSWVKT